MCVTGKILGLIASIESLSLLLAAGLYNYTLYPRTVDVWPGFCYFVGASIMVVPVLLVWSVAISYVKG